MKAFPAQEAARQRLELREIDLGPRVVAGQRIPRGVIAEELRPRLECLPRDDRVGMQPRLVGQERRVDSPDHDVRPPLPEIVGVGIGPVRGARDARDAHDIGVDAIERHFFHALVVYLDLGHERFRHQFGEGHHRHRGISEEQREGARSMAIDSRPRKDEGDLHSRARGCVRSKLSARLRNPALAISVSRDGGAPDSLLKIEVNE